MIRAIVVTGALAVVVPACTSPTEGYCDNDTQCPAGKRCNTFFHACEPRTDASIVPDGRSKDGPRDSTVPPTDGLPRDSAVPPTDGPKSKNGATCSSAGQCQSGYCTDSGQDPDKECAGTAAACGGTCDGKGACLFPGASQSCGAPSCFAGTLTTYSCDVAGACKSSAVSCGDYPCASGTACAMSCTDDTGCTGQAFCSQSKCKTWKPVTKASALLRGIGGSSSTAIWAVGDGGTVVWYNGTAWAPVNTGTTQNLAKVWASSPTDVWVTGDFGGKLLHWNGTSWTQVITGCTTSDAVGGIWGASATSVWFACNPSLAHFDGTSWATQTQPNGNAVSDIWGTSPTNVWTAGDASATSGFIHHYDGSTWTKAYGSTTAALSSIWGTSSSNIWTGGSSGTLVHYDGASWTPAASGVTGWVWGIWGGSASEVWALTLSQVLHYNGVKWTSKTLVPPLIRIWGTSVSDVWAVAADQVLRLQ